MKKSYLTAGILSAIFILTSCSNPIYTEKKSRSIEDIIEESMTDVGLSGYLPRPKAYEDARFELFGLGIYDFDLGMFNNCQSSKNQTLDQKTRISPYLRKQLLEHITGKTGDEVFQYMLSVANMDYDEINLSLALDADRRNSVDWDAHIKDKFIMILIQESHELGNTNASYEIGASLLFCFRGITQNIEDALPYLIKAANNNDSYAKENLGKLYYEGLGGYLNKEKGKQLQDEAFELKLEELRESRKTIEAFKKANSYTVTYKNPRAPIIQ